MTANPYQAFVEGFAKLVAQGKGQAPGGLAPAARPELAADAPRALILAPHPDDECIIGALPLRLLRQMHMRVVDVAVTLGSNVQRQPGRLEELHNACHFLGFDVVLAVPGGLARVNRTTRENQPDHWRASVDVLAEILRAQQPRVVFCPHEGDWNSTHIGVHDLVMDALARQSADFRCHVVETEFWGAMANPNLMVASSVEDVADLVAATSFHVGEVKRNPYHLLLPPWMQDNVRRGGELVGGQGGAAPDFAFATLYRVSRWRDGKLGAAFAGGRHLGADDDPAGVFDP